MSSWKRDVASGLVVLVPFLVIAFVVSWLYNKVANSFIIDKIHVNNGQPIQYDVNALGIQTVKVPTELLKIAIALVVFVMLTLAVGYLMRTTLGRLGEGALDNVINYIPGIRVLYNASKLAVETALTGADDLQTPVRLETWPGVWMTAFKTGKKTSDGKDVVFMPTAPNITSGFVMEVHPQRLRETDEKVEEALTRIISAGFAETNEGVPIDVDDEGIEDLGQMRT